MPKVRKAKRVTMRRNRTFAAKRRSRPPSRRRNPEPWDGTPISVTKSGNEWLVEYPNGRVYAPSFQQAAERAEAEVRRWGKRQRAIARESRTRPRSKRNPESVVIQDFTRNLAIVTMPEFQDATPDVQAALLTEAIRNPAKYDRCVKDVQARGGDVNAYAVCTAAGLRNPKAPADMSAAEINKALDRVDAESSKVTAAFIAAGRGHERPSEYLRLDDPLSRKAKELHDRRSALMYEVERRAGPGMHKLPKGFGPMRHNPRPTIGGPPLGPQRPDYEAKLARLDRQIAGTRNAKKLLELFRKKDAVVKRATTEYRDNPSYWVVYGRRAGADRQILGDPLPSDTYIREHAPRYLQEYSGSAWQLSTPREREAAIRDFVRGYKSAFRKSNPEDSAAALSESFHGLPPTRVDEYDDDVHVHEYLTELGDLVEITVDTPSGLRAELDFTGEQLKLASNESGTQLYIQGRTSLDLDALKMSSDKWRKELMVIGVMQSIVYRTQKEMDGGKLVDYIHASGEDLVDGKHKKVTNVFPTLLYDTLNSELQIAGGQQEVKPEGIIR